MKWFHNNFDCFDYHEEKNIYYHINKGSGKSKSNGPIILLPMFTTNSNLHRKAYLTVDGNHRVNDAKANGDTTIFAYELTSTFMINNSLFVTEYDQNLFVLVHDYLKLSKLS